MSYDVQVWSILRPFLPDHLPGNTRWTSAPPGWVYTKRAWQISVRPADRVELEDLPDAVVGCLPGIEFVTEFNLSPFNASPSARAFLDRIAKQFAKSVHGIVFNPQLGTVVTPGGLKRLASMGNGAQASLLTMVWQFVDGPLMRRDVGELVETLERLLPEALPRRYGLWEPPQHRWSVDGKSHFVRFMAENEGVVWYAHAPVEGLHLYVPSQRDLQRGFRSGRLELSVDCDALRQPGWSQALRRTWEALSLLVRPFYGVAYTSRGWERQRGRYWRTAEVSTRTAEPAYGNLWGQWRGLPRVRLAHAVVVGPPYVSLWKAFGERCRHLGDLEFVGAEHWSEPAGALAHIGFPPDELAEPPRRSDGDSDYPSVWPFGGR